MDDSDLELQPDDGLRAAPAALKKALAALRGEILSRYVEIAEIGQRRVASRAGYAESAVSQWKSGKGLARASSLDKAEDLADVLGAPELPALWRALATPSLLPPQALWRYNPDPDGAPVWSWIRPAESASPSEDNRVRPGVVELRWGALHVDGLEIGTDGVRRSMRCGFIPNGRARRARARSGTCSASGGPDSCAAGSTTSSCRTSSRGPRRWRRAWV
ncbi:MAG: helix-turn-helix domain-containing protein [Actinobacteria bacterium]|nr:helix-turn-helix domain-containing protein [Actinomycetota bacterium]